MMMSEIEVAARFSRLEVHVLQRWVAAGWVKPRESVRGFLFDDADIARTHLIYDLSFDMELRDEELAIVLSLLDRLNSTRTILGALTAAVERQPPQIREAIRSDLQALLDREGSTGDDDTP
jgi:chaperone modulatory protein CbpM